MSGSNWALEGKKRLGQKPGMSCPMTFTKREGQLTKVTMAQLGLLTNVYRILTCILKQSQLQTGPLGSEACSDRGSTILEDKEAGIGCKRAKEMNEK